MSPVRQAPVTLVRRRQHPCFPLSFPIPAHVEGRRPVRLVTASATTQSCATGDFLKVNERPRIGGDLCDGSFSETASLQSAGRFYAFFSGPEIPFPGNGDRERQRFGSNAGLRRRKSEHLVLPRPLGGHVGEARHSHATRQPPRDGRFHEIGRQEGKRDRHVDLPNAAPLALGNAFRICIRVGKKFVEPAAASRNRCDQERAGLGAYRTSVLG